MHFIANRPCVLRMLMVKAIEVTQVRYKPYATIERNDFSNALCKTIMPPQVKPKFTTILCVSHRASSNNEPEYTSFNKRC